MPTGPAKRAPLPQPDDAFKPTYGAGNRMAHPGAPAAMVGGTASEAAGVMHKRMCHVVTQATSRFVRPIPDKGKGPR